MYFARFFFFCCCYRKIAISDKSRKVMEWALRKKGLAKALVQAGMSLYEGSRTKVELD